MFAQSDSHLLPDHPGENSSHLWGCSHWDTLHSAPSGYWTVFSLCVSKGTTSRCANVTSMNEEEICRKIFPFLLHLWGPRRGCDWSKWELNTLRVVSFLPQSSEVVKGAHHHSFPFFPGWNVELLAAPARSHISRSPKEFFLELKIKRWCLWCFPAEGCMLC